MKSDFEVEIMSGHIMKCYNCGCRHSVDTVDDARDLSTLHQKEYPECVGSIVIFESD